MKSIDERFLAKVGEKQANGCMEWQASKLPAGYGHLRRGKASDGMILSHRYAYERMNGSIPEGMVVMHKCDNPACVNHEHLMLGKQGDNVKDMIAKKRHGWINGTPWQKLTKRDVWQVKRLYAAGVKQQQLANIFGVTRPNISLIVNRHSHA